MKDDCLKVYVEGFSGCDKKYYLPDISYEKFLDLIEWTGGSDTAYDGYLRENNLHRIMDFNTESIKEAILVFENEDRKLKFKCVYDPNEEMSQVR